MPVKSNPKTERGRPSRTTSLSSPRCYPSRSTSSRTQFRLQCRCGTRWNARRSESATRARSWQSRPPNRSASANWPSASACCSRAPARSSGSSAARACSSATEDDQDRRRTIVRVHEDYRDAMEGWLEVAFAPVRNTLERLSPQARAHFMEGWRILQEEAALTRIRRGPGRGLRRLVGEFLSRPSKIAILEATRL